MHLDAAQRLRLGVELVLHVHEEREAEERQRGGDLQILRLPRRCRQHRRQRHGAANASTVFSLMVGPPWKSPRLSGRHRTPGHYPDPSDSRQAFVNNWQAGFQPLSSRIPACVSQPFQPDAPHDPIRPHLRRRQRPDPLGRAPALPPAPARRGGDRRLLRRGRLPRLEPRVRPRHRLGRGRRRARRPPPAPRRADRRLPPSAGTRRCPGPIEGAPRAPRRARRRRRAALRHHQLLRREVGRDPRSASRSSPAPSATSSSPATRASSSPTRRSTASASSATASTPPRCDLHRRQPGERRRRRGPRHRRDPLHLDPRGPARRPRAARPPHPPAETA